MKRNTLLLTIAALLLVVGSSVGSAMAYFTTNAAAKGGIAIQAGSTTTTVEETVVNWVKYITITNEGDGQSVYVRATAFAGSQYLLTYSDGSGSWTPGSDGYYYYQDILAPGESSEQLLVRIDNIPEDAVDFNVVVVYESTPVLYDADGNPYADWDQKVVLSTEEGGVEE